MLSGQNSNVVDTKSEFMWITANGGGGGGCCKHIGWLMCSVLIDTFYMDSYDTSLPSQHVYRKIEVASCTEFA